jgi:hypothetical protein
MSVFEVERSRLLLELGDEEGNTESWIRDDPVAGYA